MSAHTFHQLYFHFAWSTRNREPLIREESRDDVLRCIEEQARQRGGIVLACNAMPDHVHLFVTLPPILAAATYIGQVKGGAAFLWNKQFPDCKPLEWQEGYGVITVRKAETDKVVAYVTNQQQIHASRKISRLLETMSSE